MNIDQKRPADIFKEALDLLWAQLDLEAKGWKRLKKGEFKKNSKQLGLTYLIWFERSHYNYIDYDLGVGKVYVEFHGLIKEKSTRLYSFGMESPHGGNRLNILTPALQLDQPLMEVICKEMQTHFLDFIDKLEADPQEAMNDCVEPFLEAEDYSWGVYATEKLMEKFGTPEQLAEYHRRSALRALPENIVKRLLKRFLRYLSNNEQIDHAWARSQTKEELDAVVNPYVEGRKRLDAWNELEEAEYQFYQAEQDMEKKTYYAWSIINSNRVLPQEFRDVKQQFHIKLYPHLKNDKE